jgi:threonine synthase
MNTEIKWADVAHMYLKSNIDVEVSYPQGVASVVRKLGIYDVEGNGLHINPILRHIADLVGKELDEYAEWLNEVNKSNTASIPAYKTYYLLSKGFDLFGLIESGQAIRKEVSDGN